MNKYSIGIGKVPDKVVLDPSTTWLHFYISKAINNAQLENIYSKGENRCIYGIRFTKSGSNHGSVNFTREGKMLLRNDFDIEPDVNNEINVFIGGLKMYLTGAITIFGVEYYIYRNKILAKNQYNKSCIIDTLQATDLLLTKLSYDKTCYRKSAR